jgi:hypothetical protein
MVKDKIGTFVNLFKERGDDENLIRWCPRCGKDWAELFEIVGFTI